jgi:hypothetical protein
MELLRKAHAASPISRVRTAFMRDGIGSIVNDAPSPPNRVVLATGRAVVGFTELRISRRLGHPYRRHADSWIGTMRTPRSPSRTASSARCGQPDRRHADTRIHNAYKIDLTGPSRRKTKT